MIDHRIKLFILLIICVTALTEHITAQQELYIEHGVEDYPLGKYISILEDKDSKLSIAEASSDSLKDKYVYYDKETVNFRFTHSAYWVRFIVVDTLSNLYSNDLFTSLKSRNWILIKYEQILEDVRTYCKIPDTEGRKFIEIRSGSKVPVNDKLVKTDGFIASIAVQKNVLDTVYMRLQTKSQFIISFRMLSAGEYIIRSSKRNMFHGIFYGIFFLLIAYNTLLYFSMRDNVYIYYVLYISSFTLFIFTYQGHYLEIIGKTFYNDYFLLPLFFVTATGEFWLLLTREFLSTKEYIPWAYKLLTYFEILAPLIVILIFLFSAPWLTMILSISLLSYYFLGFIVAVVAWKKGIYFANYYLVSLIGITIFIFVSVTTRNNLLPFQFDFWTQNSLSIGILWEALILAAAVGYRFNLLKSEKEKEKALMRNQIASDLHDEIGSNLSTISLQSRMMLGNQNLDSVSKKQLQDIVNIAGITTDTIRDIVWFINPFHDKSEDLYIRMKELASKMLINLEYTFSSKESDDRIFDLVPDLNKRRHIYLIFKEILNNIIKHSEANKVYISFSVEDKKIVMIVTDDGKGFNEEEIQKGEGLKNLRNRAALVSGDIFIESKNNKGTKIILEVPF